MCVHARVCTRTRGADQHPRARAGLSVRAAPRSSSVARASGGQGRQPRGVPGPGSSTVGQGRLRPRQGRRPDIAGSLCVNAGTGRRPAVHRASGARRAPAGRTAGLSSRRARAFRGGGVPPRAHARARLCGPVDLWTETAGTCGRGQLCSAPRKRGLERVGAAGGYLSITHP